MKFWSDSFADGEPIPVEFAFGKHHPEKNVEHSDNRNPHLAWSDLPAGAKSLVVICHDKDLPTRPDYVNKDDRSIPLELRRVEFFHWVVVDIDPTLTEIKAAQVSDGVTARGKGPDAPSPGRVGLNDFTEWFSEDPDMEGEYFGYDGPCPPWNDTRIHRYVFTLFATDLDKLPTEDEVFDGETVRETLEGHILEQASFWGSYHIRQRAMLPEDDD